MPTDLDRTLACFKQRVVLSRQEYDALEAAVLAAQQVRNRQWEHQCSDKVGGCTAVSAATMWALANALDVLAALGPATPKAST